jgi:hypothetical protein
MSFCQTGKSVTFYFGEYYKMTDDRRVPRHDKDILDIDEAIEARMREAREEPRGKYKCGYCGNTDKTNPAECLNENARDKCPHWRKLSAVICRGSWMLGTACGQCERCYEEARELIPQLALRSTVLYTIKHLTDSNIIKDLSPEFIIALTNEIRRMVQNPALDIQLNKNRPEG